MTRQTYLVSSLIIATLFLRAKMSIPLHTDRATGSGMQDIHLGHAFQGDAR
jgi:hypothetical protein